MAGIIGGHRDETIGCGISLAAMTNEIANEKASAR
jgi:hypothetical protein